MSSRKERKVVDYRAPKKIWVQEYEHDDWTCSDHPARNPNAADIEYIRSDILFEQADDFIEEIIEVCKKYNLSLSHQDTHGAFVVELYSEELSDWLRNADY